jgi:myxalamid-type polyketide synthase MxaB
VISGDGEAVQHAVAKFGRDGIRTEPLVVSHAFHSQLLEPILDEFERVAGEVKSAAPRIGFVSNVTGRFMRGEFATPAYWRSHVRGTVRFADSIAALHEQGITVFLEIGPKPTLSSLGRRCLPSADAVFLPSLSKGRDDWRQLLSTAASLYVNGASPDWSAFDREYRRQRLALPTYPFERECYWIPADEVSGNTASSAGAADRAARHPLLGRQLRSASKDIQFESELTAVSPRFLNDHQVYGMVVLPATAYMEIVVAAASHAFPGRACELRDLEFSDALVLPDERKRIVQLVVTPDGSDQASYQLFSLKESSGARESWRLHAAGQIGLGAVQRGRTASQPVGEIKARCGEQMTGTEYYDALRQRGNDYGPAFRGIQQIWRGTGEALGEIRLPDGQIAGAEAFHVHPAVLDACFQLLGAAVSRDHVRSASDDETYLPVSLERFRIHARPGIRVWGHVVLRAADQVQGELLAGDVSLIGDDGRVVAEAEGLFVKRASRDALRRSLQQEGSDWLYELQWRPRELDTTAANVAGSAWLIFADESGVGARLGARLSEQNTRVVLVRRSDAVSAGGDERVDPMRPEDFERLWTRISTDDPRQEWNLVHLWNLDAPGEPASDGELADACATGTASLLHLTQAAAQASDRVRRLCVLTQRAVATAAADDVAVAQAPAWGLGRTISLEYPELHCKRIDFDSVDAAADVDDLIAELSTSDGEEQIAFRRGVRHVSRLVRIAARSSARDASGKTDRAVRLDISDRGVFDNLKLEPHPRRAPGAGEVEIRIHAGGLNFRDVLNALGVYEGHPGPLGTECAGTIVAVGEGVDEFVVGQQVMAMAPGSFGTYVTSGADLVVAKPTNVSIAEAAGIPIAFLTADYALNYRARMAAGDRVLIHAAAGGLGLAAVQLAQRAGAEIFATAGSPRKREYLRSLGIQHIFNSRTLEFSDDVLAATGGRGVDIVLNALNGEFIPKSLAALRSGGRFLEMGKAGIWTSEQVAEVRPDVVYESIYMGEVARPLIGAILRRIGQAFEDGALQLLPTKQFALDDAAAAFRFMAQARHIGKIVVVDDSAKHVAATAAKSEAGIRADASYLITGGLGSLGLLVARRFASLGAKHLVLMSRGEPSAPAQAALRDIEALGARVVLARGDVASRQDVDRVFGEIDGTLPALRGIVHAAGVIDDGVLTQQRWDRFVRVMAPKVRGAWNLHRAVGSRQLDFFVMFSSIVSLFGGQGQANYAAANAFLDGLAHHRRARAAAGTSINWGPWEAGMAATVGNRDQQRWAETGVTPIGGEQGLALLEDILRNAHVQPCVWGVDWSVYLQQFPVGQEPALVSELVGGLTNRRVAAPAAAPQAVLKDAIESTPPNRRWNLVMSHVRDRAVKVLGIDPASPIEPGVALSEMGLDSLMAVELRNALSAAVGRPLPATVLFKYPSLQALTDFLAYEVLGIAAGEEKAAAEIDEELAAIAPLSDDEVSRLLAEEIRSVSQE